jgi:hypothetical protein
LFFGIVHNAVPVLEIVGRWLAGEGTISQSIPRRLASAVNTEVRPLDHDDKAIVLKLVQPPPRGEPPQRQGPPRAPFVPIFRHTIKTQAWRALSVGARATFLALKANYNSNACLLLPVQELETVQFWPAAAVGFCPTFPRPLMIG